MDKEKSVIKIDDSISPIFHQHLSSLNLGYSVQNSPAIYHHIDTEKKYLHLAGSIFWPGEINPGFILIMGVRTEADQIIYECLEEYQDNGIDNLLNRCIALRDRYGFGKATNILRYWYGDSERFSPLLNQFNQRLRNSQPVQEGIYLASPIAFDKGNHFELYLRQMQSALMPNNKGRKSLYLGNCQALRNAIQNLPADAATSFTEDDSPAVAAVGSLIHSLMAITPWKCSVQETTDIFNDIDDYDTYAREESNSKGRVI